VHSTPLTPPLALWSAQLDQSEASITHGTLDIRAFFKHLEVHNAWCVAGGARPCTRHLLYLTPGAGFSSIRPRHTVMFQSHTIHWIFELFLKNLEVQRARPVTRDRVPDTTEWGASRVVRCASRVVRTRALDPFDTSPGAVVSPARSVRGINHTRYTGYSSFLKKTRSSQRVVRRGWCAPMHSTPVPLTPPLALWSAQLDQSEAHTVHWKFEL